MKRVFALIILVSLTQFSQAQFTRAHLQATGLTCAMCSNAVNKALQKVSFIQTVRSDIKNSSFSIQFKTGSEVNIDELRAAVEDAGFSVGSLRLTAMFDNVKISNDQHVKIGNQHFHFLEVTDQSLSGEKDLLIVDKGFVSDKLYKKYSAATKKSCVKTGKSEACCEKEGFAVDTRIYHVTI